MEKKKLHKPAKTLGNNWVVLYTSESSPPPTGCGNSCGWGCFGSAVGSGCGSNCGGGCR